MVSSVNSGEDGEDKVGEGGVELCSKGPLLEKLESLMKRALRAFAPMLLVLGAGEALGSDVVLWKNREKEPREVELFEKDSILMMEIFEVSEYVISCGGKIATVESRISPPSSGEQRIRSHDATLTGYTRAITREHIISP